MSEVETHFSTTWAAAADLVEAQLAAVDPILFDAARIAPGDAVLDVGCGPGSTTATAAAIAGTAGNVCGIDIAQPLLDAARAIHARAPGAPIEWRHADAQTHRFEQAFDVVLSRFGTLFFDDPVAAFTNVRAATRPGGRLAVVVWRPRDESELFARPVAVAVEAARAMGHELVVAEPDDGPFRFGVDTVMLDVLDRAGWRDGTITPCDLAVGAGGPDVTPARVAAAAVALGPVATLIREAPTEVIEHVTAAIADDLATYRTPAGIRVNVAVAIVTAEAPAD